MNKTGRYGCTAGLGCGYNLGWTVWWEEDTPEHKTYNPLYRKETERDQW
jgi:hypothetical protein